MDGTSPMHVFCKEQNIPAAMFGATSDRSLIHAPNEHLTISSYIEDIKIIAAVMNQMALEGLNKPPAGGQARFLPGGAAFRPAAAQAAVRALCHGGPALARSVQARRY